MELATFFLIADPILMVLGAFFGVRFMGEISQGNWPDKYILGPLIGMFLGLIVASVIPIIVMGVGAFFKYFFTI